MKRGQSGRGLGVTLARIVERCRLLNDIVSLDFRRATEREQFGELVRSQIPGKEVPIVFYRGGIKVTKNITPRRAE